MDIAYENIGSDEFDRLQALYSPFTQSIRDLIDAAVRSGADEHTIRAAQVAIDAVTATLAGAAPDGQRALRHRDTGRPLAWRNPVVGMRNPIAPPLTIEQDADGRCWSEFSLGAAYEGPPGLVHGGICALVLDHVLGEAASAGLTKALFTGTISCRYLRGTPLGPLRAEAAVDRSEGIKTFVRGNISDAQGITVEAEGIFIMPVWARDGR